MMARMRVSGTGSAGSVASSGGGSLRHLRWGSLLDGRLCRAGRTRGAQNVFLGDAAFGAGAGDAAELEAVLFGDAARKRRRADAAGFSQRCGQTLGGGCAATACALRTCGAAPLAALRLAPLRRGDLRARFADDRDHGVDFDGGAFREADFRQHAGNRRGNLSVHLVSRDLEERLVDCDGVADGFLSHLVIVPSKIDSPIWGMMTSVGMHSSLRGSVFAIEAPTLLARAARRGPADRSF